MNIFLNKLFLNRNFIRFNHAVALILLIGGIYGNYIYRDVTISELILSALVLIVAYIRYLRTFGLSIVSGIMYPAAKNGIELCKRYKDSKSTVKYMLINYDNFINQTSDILYFVNMGSSKFDILFKNKHTGAIKHFIREYLFPSYDNGFLKYVNVLKDDKYKSIYDFKFPSRIFKYSLSNLIFVIIVLVGNVPMNFYLIYYLMIFTMEFLFLFNYKISPAVDIDALLFHKDLYIQYINRLVNTMVSLENENIYIENFLSKVNKSVRTPEDYIDNLVDYILGEHNIDNMNLEVDDVT